MPKKTTQENDAEFFPVSPLLASDRRLNKTLHSTINPDRLDQSRFSEMKEEEESPFRVILYVIVVIIIGVGSAFGVRQLISKNDNGEEDTEEVVEEEVQERENVIINTTKLADSTAVNAPKEEDFSEETVTVVGSLDVATTGLALRTFEYKNFTTFSRMIFTIEGLPAGSAFPQTTANFDSIANRLTLKFNGITNIDEDITSDDITINDLVTEVRYNTTTTEFLVFISEESKYSLSVKDNQLFVDIKSTKAPVSETQQPETTQPEETTPTPTPTQPTTGVKYDNEFSQTEQTIRSNVTANNIPYNEVYYEDTAQFFEIAWGARNKVGEQYIPNATAKLVEEGGKIYIDVTINNLSSVSTQSVTDQSNVGINLAGANFIRSELVSFANGTAKYRIQLKKKADYRLISIKTISGETQVLALQIKD